METHVIDLEGTDIARWGGIFERYSKGPICRLARTMKEMGETGVLDIRRDGKPVFARNMSVDWWAGRSASEPSASSVKLVKYVPDPRFSEGR